MFKAFSAKSESNETQSINLKPFTQLKQYTEMTDTYKNFQYKMDDFIDMATADTAGYFGTNHRIKETHSKTFKQLENFDLIKSTIIKDSSLVKVM